jgi:hypothetical protein
MSGSKYPIGKMEPAEGRLISILISSSKACVLLRHDLEAKK